MADLLVNTARLSVQSMLDQPVDVFWQSDECYKVSAQITFTCCFSFGRTLLCTITMHFVPYMNTRCNNPLNYAINGRKSYEWWCTLWMRLKTMGFIEDLLQILLCSHWRCEFVNVSNLCLCIYCFFQTYCCSVRRYRCSRYDPTTRTIQLWVPCILNRRIFTFILLNIDRSLSLEIVINICWEF